MRSLQTRFIISHILPVLVIVPVVGFVLVYLLETQIILTQMSQDISDKAHLIAETVNGRPEVLQDIAEAESFINGVSIYIEEQIFLFGPNGEMLATNDAPEDNSVETLAGESALETAETGADNLVITYGLAEQRAIVLVPVRDINEKLVGIVGVTDTLANAANQFQRLRYLIAGALLLQLILGALIGWLLARRLEKPIEHAASAVVAIANGRTIEPVPIQGPKEIQDLSEAVNILAERLRLLEETRRRSLANIVHELGRPLGAINTATYVLRQGAGDDAEVRDELLQGIQSAVHNMEPLLNDLSQLYGQVEGNIQISPQPVDLNEWLLPALLPWRTVARESGLEWQADIAEDLPVVEIDPDRMGQILGNLLSNAIKYTAENALSGQGRPANGGGMVAITADADQEMVNIAVCDTGPGIDAQEQERIFEPFYRSQAHRRFPQGLGLGLTIARDLVEAHGGTLELVSEPGEGSCFVVHLPRNSSS